MNLLEDVQTILGKVKDVTGKEVIFVEKDDLNPYATIKIRNDLPSHIMYYNKGHHEIINHLIAHECGHILRMWTSPEDKRFLPGSTRANLVKAIPEISKQLDPLILTSFSPTQRNNLMTDLWYPGLIRQLTNMPVDIMIEKWLYDTYPALRPLQHQSILKQLSEVETTMTDPTIRQMTPAIILYPSVTMSYVFFRLLGLHMRENFIRIYKEIQFITPGKKLAAITETEYVDTHEGDVAMINRWADFFGLASWFIWTKLEDAV